jgi:predicted oxidoreductase
MAKVERVKLSKSLEISRAITGLWQIADMEKDGKTLDPAATSKFMEPYVIAGLNTFDMAGKCAAIVISGRGKCVEKFAQAVWASGRDRFAQSVEIQLLTQTSACAIKVQRRKLNGFTKVVLDSKYPAWATA